jgi:hypothetical protein
MANILLLLAVLGMVVGVYAVAMPTLTRRGWHLPFASFFGDADEADEPFVPSFELPGRRETPAALVSVAAPSIVPPPEEELILPPVARPADLDLEEDDPTLTPLFEDLIAEVEQTPINFGDESEQASGPHLTLVSPLASEDVKLAEKASETPPADDALQLGTPGEDDMMSLFSESSDEGRKPNILADSIGEVTIKDLMEEVRLLQEFLNKKNVA